MMRISFGRVARPIIVGAILASVPTMPLPALAHEKHEPGSAEHGTVSAADSARSHPAPGSGDTSAGPTSRGRYRIPPLAEAVGGHLHNKLVHFPIALTPIAVLLLMWGRRQTALQPAGVALVWLSAASAAAAYFAGRVQQEAFRGDPKEWVVGLHETWGTVAAVALAFWALLTLLPGTRRHLWLWGLVATGAVMGTGFLGGLVAHG